MYRPHPLFDPVWYRDTYPDAAESGMDALSHYLVRGDAAGLSPHPLFDAAWYVARYPDALESGLTALGDYLASGDAAGHWPNPLFDPAFYGAQHPEVAGEGGKRLSHYAEHGGRDGANPHPLFESSWYLAQYPESGKGGHNALVHYLAGGEERGCRPHPLFDPCYYRASNPDLGDWSPVLSHYASYGAREHRSPSPLFDAAWYASKYSADESVRLDPLGHYLTKGDAAGFWPNPLFDPDFYGAQHPELEARGGARLRHYAKHGGRDGTSPHPLFQAAWYLDEYPEVAASGMDPLAHYLSQGETLGYRPNPFFDPRYYVDSHPELGAMQEPLLSHYHRIGAREGRSPIPLFDGRWYLAQHPEIDERVDHPLAHYLSEGAAADADPHALFDASWYREQHPELDELGPSPLAHFLSHSAAADADPHPLFDSSWYRDVHALAPDEIPVIHYLEKGAALGLEPNPLFNSEHYLKQYELAMTPRATPLGLFIDEGLAENHRPGPFFDFCLQFFRQSHPELRSRSVNPLAGYLSERCSRLSCPEAELPADLPPCPQPEVSIIIPAFGKIVYVLACLRSIRRAENGVGFEVIVVDDGLGEDDVALLSKIESLRLIRNEANLGFAKSCNRGAAAARGERLVFLNNDTLVTDGWLDALLGTFRTFPDVGLVGSKLVYPSGVLQEAGGIVWQDGDAANYGHGEDPDDPRFNFARKVDYASAASLMIGRRLFDELGGFDEAYAPAFYEDTDLAFRVRRVGFDVVYQPGSMVLHFGGAAYGRDARRGLKRHQERNRRIFRERWSSALAEHPQCGSDLDAAALRHYRGGALVMDATTPTPNRDSGSLRMFNLLRVLQRLGYAVTFLPADLSSPEPYVGDLRRSGVRVACPPCCESVEAHLERWGFGYNLCLLSRPRVGGRWLEAVRLLCPRAKLLYDTVDLHFLRRQREIAIRGTSTVTATEAKQELWASRRADGVIVVSEFDEKRLHEEDPTLNVHVLSNIHEARPSSTPFSERDGILFIGGFLHAPNVDAVQWFVQEVLPLIHERLPELRFHVVGSETPDEIFALASDRVAVEGFVPEVSEFFSRCRLSVAPLRYGSGVKGKVNQSMSYGLPCVATSIAAEGMEAEPGSEILVADGARQFAATVVRLYQSEALWNEISAHAVRSLERTFSMEVAEEKMRQILRDCGRL